MAALQGSFVVPTVALTGGTAQTLLQVVAPSNQRLKLIRLMISFDGTNSANTPALIKLERQTGGTFTNTTVAPKKINDPSGTGETLQAIGKTAVTVEPTEGDILEEYNLSVFGGTLIYPFPPGQEPLVYGGSLIGVKVNAAQTVNCSLTIVYEE